MTRIYLSDELCDRARDKMDEIMVEGTGGRGEANQLRAATDLVKHCQQQDRYNLKPQTPEDFDRATRHRASGAKELEDLTSDELIELQRQMIGGDFERRNE